MTDAEKLQKLVELAWENGWQHRQGHTVNKVDEVEPGLLCFINSGPMWEDSEGYRTIESVIFDHDFIKALCRAKYPATSWGGNDPFKYDEPDKNAPVVIDVISGTLWWHIHIRNLAISEDRIKYLWENFGDE